MDVRKLLRTLQDKDPTLFAEYFDPRLLEVPVFRIAPREEPPEGIKGILSNDEEGDTPKPEEPKPSGKRVKKVHPEQEVQQSEWVVIGSTPGGVYKLLKREKSGKQLFEYRFCNLVVLDEASQMNLPEALMASLALANDGEVIVVGDHRQMPPIVKHDWEGESRRTFQEYEVYRSLFDTLRLHNTPPPMIRFAESFRLHGDMAEFLRKEIYSQDGIDYHSHKTDLLPSHPTQDEFIDAVLNPEYPLVVIVHEESSSQVRNLYEQTLVGPILKTLADKQNYNLEPKEGLGVVVPHKAQRAAMQQAFPELSLLDPETKLPILSAVDTVERFQGGERTVIVVSATESDPSYLLTAAGFLLDPRRLTVAISRAKRKMILVASRSVFTLFSPDEETFANAQLWKNLLNQTCTTKLWNGLRDGIGVTVWGGKRE